MDTTTAKCLHKSWFVRNVSPNLVLEVIWEIGKQGELLQLLHHSWLVCIEWRQLLEQLLEARNIEIQQLQELDEVELDVALVEEVEDAGGGKIGGVLDVILARYQHASSLSNIFRLDKEK